MTKGYSVGRAEEVNTALGITAWLHQTTAPEWLADARDEAEHGKELAAELGEDEWSEALVRSLRREVVFAVCFSEAFLLEYLRDRVFIDAAGDRDFEGLAHFLRSLDDDSRRPIWGRQGEGRGRGIRARWKETVKALYDEGELGEPDFDGQTWEDFHGLVLYRNSIVHAAISWPTRGSEDIKEPSPATLAQCGPGWATCVVTKLARGLHDLNPKGLDPPEYLEQ